MAASTIASHFSLQMGTAMGRAAQDRWQQQSELVNGGSSRPAAHGCLTYSQGKARDQVVNSSGRRGAFLSPE